MPEVIIKARFDWFPVDRDIGNPAKNGTGRRSLTFAVANKMPELVVEAFRSLSLGHLEPGEVVFDIVKFHALCSANQPDIAITISPAWSEEREAAKAGLVANIQTGLRTFITVDLAREPGSVSFPSIDIMVKLVNEAGVAVNDRGEITSQW